MVKIDLHVHSIASKDGGITEKQMHKVFDASILDVIAITDHGSANYAIELKKVFGAKIIVGQEIKTNEGEIIGLFITQTIADNKTLHDTITMIKDQGGLVYVPHPFETIRKGLKQNSLENELGRIDIIETHNGRTSQNKSFHAVEFAAEYSLPQAASSDAHSLGGIGRTYMKVAEFPTRENLISLLKGDHLIYQKPPISAKLAPKINRLKKLTFISRAPKV